MKIKLNFYIDVGTNVKPTELSDLMNDLNCQILNNLVLNKKVLGVEVLSTNKEIEAYMPDSSKSPSCCCNCGESCEDDDEYEDDEDEDGDIEVIDFSDISTEELLEEIRSRINANEDDE